MEGYSPFGDLKTWYKVQGDLRSGKAPLLIVHGGPGYTHDYLENFGSLAGEGRAVILYDQVGNGRSSPGPDAPDFWTVDRFVDELGNLVAHLDLNRYVLLGHSMGAGIAAMHAIDRPAGLRGLVLANGYAAANQLLDGIWELRRALPKEVQAALSAHETDGSFDHPDYVAASGEFFRRHVCRLPDWPEALLRSAGAMASHPKVFVAAYGPSIFQLSGTLRGWSIVDRLPEIEVPVLSYRGAFDEVTPACSQTLLGGLRQARSITFARSSHTPHLEEREACLAQVSAFLDDIERRQRN